MQRVDASMSSDDDVSIRKVLGRLSVSSTSSQEVLDDVSMVDNGILDLRLKVKMLQNKLCKQEIQNQEIRQALQLRAGYGDIGKRTV